MEISSVDRTNFTVTTWRDGSKVSTRPMTQEEHEAAARYIRETEAAIDAQIAKQEAEKVARRGKDGQSDAQFTVQQDAKLNLGAHDAAYKLPGVTHRESVESLSDGDRIFDRSNTKFVPNKLDLEPPEEDTTRSISDQVFSAPIEEISAKADSTSPVKDAPNTVYKNLALIVGIVGLAFFLAM